MKLSIRRCVLHMFASQANVQVCEFRFKFCVGLPVHSCRRLPVTLRALYLLLQLIQSMVYFILGVHGNQSLFLIACSHDIYSNEALPISTRASKVLTKRHLRNQV